MKFFKKCCTGQQKINHGILSVEKTNHFLKNVIKCCAGQQKDGRNQVYVVSGLGYLMYPILCLRRRSGTRALKKLMARAGRLTSTVRPGASLAWRPSLRAAAVACRSPAGAAAAVAPLSGASARQEVLTSLLALALG